MHLKPETSLDILAIITELEELYFQQADPTDMGSGLGCGKMTELMDMEGKQNERSR